MQTNFHEFFPQSSLMTDLPATATTTANATRLNKQSVANQKGFVQIGDTVYGKLSKYFRKPGVIVDTEGEDKNLIYTIRWEGGAISTCKRRGFWNEYELNHQSASESRLPFDVPTLLQESSQMQEQQHFLPPSQHYPEHQKQLLHHPVASVVTTAQRISQSNSFGLSNNNNNPMQQSSLLLHSAATLHPTAPAYVNMIDHQTSSSHPYINLSQTIDSVTFDEQGHKQKQRRLDTQSLSPSNTFQPTTTTTTTVPTNNNPNHFSTYFLETSENGYNNINNTNSINNSNNQYYLANSETLFSTSSRQSKNSVASTSLPPPPLSIPFPPPIDFHHNTLNSSIYNNNTIHNNSAHSQPHYFPGSEMSPPSTGGSHSHNNSNNNSQQKRASMHMSMSMHSPRERSSSTPLADNTAVNVATTTHTSNVNTLNSNFDAAIASANHMNNNNSNETNNANTNTDINQMNNINPSNGMLLNTTITSAVVPNDPSVNTAVLPSVYHSYPFHPAFTMPMASSEAVIEHQKAQSLKELHRLQQEMQEMHKIAVIASSTMSEDNDLTINVDKSKGNSDNNDNSSTMWQATGAESQSMDTTAAAVLSTLSANNNASIGTNMNAHGNLSKSANNTSDIIKALALASQQQQLQYRPPSLDPATDNTNNNNFNNNNNSNNKSSSSSDGESHTNIVHSVSKCMSSDNENVPVLAPVTGLIATTHGKASLSEPKEEIAPYHILLPINKISEEVRGGRRSHKRFLTEENDSQSLTNTNNKAVKICRYICKICKAFKASHYCARCSRFHDKEKFILAICEPATGRDCLIQHLRKLGVPEGHN